MERHGPRRDGHGGFANGCWEHDPLRHVQAWCARRDSLGYEQVIRPGEVNLMTAGRGIAHAEDTV
ncbi:pirin family protein [Paraburkholderia sp. Se-20369]|nr:pirin family protein [Paraburkholderia sp. Se-20369]